MLDGVFLPLFHVFVSSIPTRSPSQNPHSKFRKRARNLEWATRLLGDPGMYVVHMSEHGDDRVKLYRFQPPSSDILRKVGFDGDRTEINRMTSRQIEQLIKISRSQ